MSFAETVMRAAAPRGPQVDLRKPSVMLANLLFMYQLMVASEPLLELAADQLVGMADSFDIRLCRYLRRHLIEERGHAEWLAADLASADVDVTAAPLSLEAVQLAGGQYYVVRHQHPAALLGYMAALECNPAPLHLVEDLERLHGAPLMRTLRYHAVHDQDHGADLRRLMDAAPDRLHGLILSNAQFAAMHLGAAARQFGGNDGH